MISFPVYKNLKLEHCSLLGILVVVTMITPELLFAQLPGKTGTEATKSKSAHKQERARQTTKILLIGNSFTYWRGGLDRHLKTLSRSMALKPDYQTKAVTRGGASLEVMWKRTSAAAEIKKGNYDIVILQEDLPETTVESFRIYSKKFVDLVRQMGARPILFMTWDYKRLNWISMEEIADAHLELSRKLKVEVAPVGVGWALSKKRRPDLDMYEKDAEHPSAAGMFLSLLVIESTISGKSPLNRSSKKLKIKGLEKHAAKDIKDLQTLAEDAIKIWQQK